MLQKFRAGILAGAVAVGMFLPATVQAQQFEGQPVAHLLDGLEHPALGLCRHGQLLAPACGDVGGVQRPVDLHIVDGCVGVVLLGVELHARGQCEMSAGRDRQEIGVVVLTDPVHKAERGRAVQRGSNDWRRQSR